MAAGLKIWDASGNLIVDLTTRIGRVVAVQAVGANSTGSVTVSQLAQGDPFTAFLTNVLSGKPLVTVSGTTVSWSPDAQGFAAGNILIGVY